jgi:hypothetical protein
MYPQQASLYTYTVLAPPHYSAIITSWHKKMLDSLPQRL